MPNLSDLRILLWDIYGTILRSAKATTFTEYTRPVLESVFGTAGRIDEVPLEKGQSGKGEGPRVEGA